MLLMSHIVSSVAAAAVASAPLHFPVGPARILVLQDASQQSAPLSMARRALQTDLLGDPARVPVAHEAPAPHLLSAQELRAAAQGDLARGLNEFHALQLDDAADHYGAAVQKLHRVAALTGDLTDLPNALSMLAATLLLMDEPQAAAPVLARLRALQPTLPLPASLFNPDTASIARRVAKRLAAPRKISVEAFPAGSEIWVDGRYAGSDAANLQLDPTLQHYVFITHGNAAPLAALIDPTAPGAPRDFSFTLPDALAQQAGDAATTALRYQDARAAAGTPGSFPNPEDPDVRELEPDEIWVLRANPRALECIRFQLGTGRRTDLTLPLPTSWAEAHRVADACRNADTSVP